MKNNDFYEWVELYFITFIFIAFMSVAYVVTHSDYFTLAMPVMILLALGFAAFIVLSVIAVVVARNICYLTYRKARKAIKKAIRKSRRDKVVITYGSH